LILDESINLSLCMGTVLVIGGIFLVSKFGSK
jgi:uncharacterized membrane protein